MKRAGSIRLRIAQEVEVCAKLKGVLSFYPGYVVDKIVDRHLIIGIVSNRQAGVVGRLIIVQKSEENDVLGMITTLSETLPRIAIPEIIHQIRSESGRVTYRITFAVVDLTKLRT